MSTLNQQRAAVARALRDKEKELVKANQSKNEEWIHDVSEEIVFLKDAVETFKLFEQFSLLVERLAK